MQRAKETAIKRAIAGDGAQAGLRLQDLEEAVRAEYRENEIFPPSDTVEDWLKLIDYDPENVVRVTPVRPETPRPEKQSGRVV